MAYITQIAEFMRVRVKVRVRVRVRVGYAPSSAWMRRTPSSSASSPSA